MCWHVWTDELVYGFLFHLIIFDESLEHILPCTYCASNSCTSHIWLERGHGSHRIHCDVRPAIDSSRDVCQFCTAPYLNLLLQACCFAYSLVGLHLANLVINLIHISSTKWQYVRLMVFSAHIKCPSGGGISCSLNANLLCDNVLINTETAVLRSHEITFDHRYSSSYTVCDMMYATEEAKEDFIRPGE